MNIPDIISEEWTDLGAVFLTAPEDRGAEIRCYTRDPGDYPIG